MKKWEDCHREDLYMIPVMIAAGWTPEFSNTDKRYDRITPDYVPGDNVKFNKEVKSTWHQIDWKTHEYHWNVADQIKGKSYHTRTYKSLNEALKNE